MLGKGKTNRIGKTIDPPAHGTEQETNTDALIHSFPFPICIHFDNNNNNNIHHTHTHNCRGAFQNDMVNSFNNSGHVSAYKLFSS